jgi:hypothetical protein
MQEIERAIHDVLQYKKKNEIKGLSQECIVLFDPRLKSGVNK